MANLPLRHISYKDKLLKCYFRLYAFPLEKYFSSKDNKDETYLSSEAKQNKEAKNDDKIKEKLNKSGEASTAPQDSNKEAAKKKLFSLLSELKVTPSEPKVKPILAKPLKRPTKKERFGLEKEKSPEEEIAVAAKAVATNIKGDPEKTLQELNRKLGALNLAKVSSDSSEKITATDIGIDEKLQEDLMSSVRDVASTVPSPVKSRLTQRLLKLSVESKEKSKRRVSISDTMKGIKLEKAKHVSESPKKDLESRQMVKRLREFPTRPKVQTKVNIYQSAALDIFPLDQETKTETKKTIWQSLEEKKLKLLTEFAPANAFEEMMMWTEQGKHWKFPIDNEIDIGPEENVGFNEHVFLEQHLHGFPTKGPIRHFMELVVVGLSKNPYITVERKIENINWFRDYFKEKEDILKEYGALE